MDFAQIRASLEPLLETHPIKVVVFAGGEPSLLKNDLVKAIACCAQRGIQTRVVTNASWTIDARRRDCMLKRWARRILGNLHRGGWLCHWCRDPVPLWRRADARFCCAGCRKRASRARKLCGKPAGFHTVQEPGGG